MDDPRRGTAHQALRRLLALPGLARKLPHYGKYSWLVFAGDAPEIRAKGLWTAGDSELSVWLTPDQPQIKHRERPALADQAK
jgi:aminopeptidase N